MMARYVRASHFELGDLYAAWAMTCTISSQAFDPRALPRASRPSGPARRPSGR
jgi:hypothetical protein